MMPDTNFKNCLLGIFKDLDERDQGGLKSLGIICRVCRPPVYKGDPLMSLELAFD